MIFLSIYCSFIEEFENVIEFSKMYNKSNTSNIFPILFTIN